MCSELQTESINFTKHQFDNDNTKNDNIINHPVL